MREGRSDPSRASSEQEGGNKGGNNPGGGPPGGRRQLGEDKGSKSFDAKAKVEFDPKGRKIFDGYAPGQNFKKRSGAEIAGEVKQASQEAPEAIEQQRIPKPARDMAKGYFRNLGGQNDKEAKKENKP